MLVLSRSVGQALLIGPDVRVVINGVRGNQVSLAIEAPRDVRVIRPEVLRRDMKTSRPVSRAFRWASLEPAKANPGMNT